MFDDVTRLDPSSSLISFRECESSMFRSRRKLQPKIPATGLEFSELLPTTIYSGHFKASVMSSEGIGMIFFSDKLYTFISDINDVQFDGTFQTVPNQFYQLWTILLCVGRHCLLAIHCLMTSKEEGLYTAVIRKIKSLLPQFQPTSTMSDWEQAAKNAFKHEYPDAKINGCWFHFTQAIWRKTQKVGLVQNFRQNNELAVFIRNLMVLPFLPPELIRPTFLYFKFLL